MYAEMKEAWNELIAPGGAFEVKTMDIRGNPTRVFANAPPSLRELWLASQQFADRDYIVFQDERWTYAQAHQEVAAIANWLIAQGVEPGDRVAIAMRNYPEWMLAYWAVTSVGAVVSGMNAWWVGPEMVYGIQDSDPKVVIVDQERLDRLMPVRDQVPDPILVGVRLTADVDGVVPWQDVLATGGELPQVSIDPDADAVIFYTSGTTGKPKGAMQTHRGCVSNVMNIVFAGALNQQVQLKLGLIQPADLENPPVGVSLVTTPLFHVTANNCVAQGSTAAGAKLILMYKWDAGEALRLIEREGVTSMSGVPVMSRELLAHPDFATTNTSSLLALGGGGAQLQPDLVERIEKSVATARPSTGYGMTETCGIITSISGDFFTDRPDSCGPAMPTFEAKVVDADGNALPSGQVGELWVRGAPVIRCYINKPEATAETITDGWLHTGDVARIDEDGFIYIVDRLKDMVLRGGENVYCAEVEAAIFDHDAVAECVVFGVPDDRLGEEVGAAVVIKPGASITADELRAHCAAQISKHKLPRYIWLRTEVLPRNANGKFLKREMRDILSIEDAA